MAVTNNLRVQVDLPVWEWCKFAPVITTAVSSLTTGSAGTTQRYLYYQILGTVYRYDTISDSWHQLSAMPVTAGTIMNNNVYSATEGYYGRAIGPGTGNNTIQMAGLSGNALVGYKIRIIEGTGAGQERTITAVSAPIMEDKGVTTTAGQSSIVDASVGTGIKAWKFNQYRDYQIRVEYGVGRTQMRKILYNSQNSITWSDALQLPVNPWAQCLTWTSLSATAGAQALYVIESHIVTVNSNWTVNPDNTSKYKVVSGGIWNVTQGTTTAPFFSLQYYDILSDVWYNKQTQSGLKTAVFLAGSDLSMERMGEIGGAIVASTAVVSATARSVTTGATMTPMAYANFEIRIVRGLGIGQTRTILSNTATIFNLVRDFAITPDNTSSYEVWKDVGKLFMIGGNDAGMLQYNRDTDQWTTGKQLDFGQSNALAAQRSGATKELYPISISSIARSATGMKTAGAITTAGGGYSVDDLLTVDAKGGILRVTSVDAAGGVTGVALESCGTGYTTGAKAVVASPLGGLGCTITLAAGNIDFVEYAITAIIHDFVIGDSVTITGANGVGAGKFNGAYTIIGAGYTTAGAANTTTFFYCSGGDPGAASATIANSPSATQIVDCTKNWTVNEHAGKLVQMANNVVLGTGQVRRIVSNTATTLVWTLAATSPAIGVWKYVIEDIKPFGTELTVMGRLGGGGEGFATGGSATTLIDSTKNWQTNYFSKVVGRKVRIVEGTGVGNEISIVSNTATTLTYAAQAFTPDATTRYAVMGAFGTVVGAGGIRTLAVAPIAGGTGYAVGDQFTITGGTATGWVLAVNAGVVTAVGLIFGGVSGYTVATAATVKVAGGGNNALSVSVTAITAVASTSVFEDNNQNWGVNQWAGKRVRFLSGTSQGNEYAIISNTATTITTAVGTAPDVSTAYAILEATPKAYGIHLDVITESTDTTLNHRYMYAWTGTATMELSRYNINTEHWEFLSYFPQFETLTTGAMYAYDGTDRIYVNLSTLFVLTGRMMYYDLVKNIVVPFSTIPYGHSTLVSGNRMEVIKTIDGLKYLYMMRHSGTEMWRTLLFT